MNEGFTGNAFTRAIASSSVPLRLHACDCFLQRTFGIGIGRLVEAHVTVADLQKGKALLPRGHCLVDDTE